MFRRILQISFLTSPLLGFLLFLALMDVFPNTTEGIVYSLTLAYLFVAVLAVVGFSVFARRPTVLPKENP